MQPAQPSNRSSFWIRTFELARHVADERPHEWVKVGRLYTRATAAQVASDINRAHVRAEHLRMKGVAPGERWEARWGSAPNGPFGDYVVWIRLVAEPT